MTAGAAPIRHDKRKKILLPGRRRNRQAPAAPLPGTSRLIRAATLRRTAPVASELRSTAARERFDAPTATQNTCIAPPCGVAQATRTCLSAAIGACAPGKCNILHIDQDTVAIANRAALAHLAELDERNLHNHPQPFGGTSFANCRGQLCRNCGSRIGHRAEGRE